MKSECRVPKSSILLVDDDPQIRRLCRITLEMAGFKVFEADSPTAALAIWETESAAIDLLLTDFNMPGMTGLELAKLLHDQRPSLPVLLISGCYLGTPPVPSEICFLEKPFSLPALTAAVRKGLQLGL